jgi:hypothetical protein
MRPGSRAARVLLDAPPRALAAAAVTAARRRFPVDAAIGLALEADKRIEHRWQGAGAAAWLAQLEHGYRWWEDELPIAWLPADVAPRAASGARLGLALAEVACPHALERLLAREHETVRRACRSLTATRADAAACCHAGRGQAR